MRHYILVLLCVTGTAYAQYGDAYHTADQQKIDKDRKAYNDAYIDALRKNTNNTPTNTDGASYDKDAARKLADIYAARAGRKTSAELAKDAEVRQTLIQQRIAEREADNKAILQRAFKGSALNTEAGKLREPIIAAYIDAGFDPYDAAEMGKKEVSSDGNQINVISITGHVTAVESAQKLKSSVNSESFEEVAYLISDLQQNAGAPVTCLKALNTLAKRFPDKQQLTDHLSNASFTLFFNTAFGNKNFDFMRGMTRYQSKDYPEFREMADMWEAYFLRDPAAAIAGAAKVRKFHPLLLLAEKAYVAKDYKKADALGRTLLLTPVAELDYEVALDRIGCAARYNYISKRADNEFMWSEYDAVKVHFPYSTPDLLVMAKAQRVPPMVFVGAMASESFKQSPDKFNWMYKQGNADSKWKLKATISELAAAGDADAKQFLGKN